VYTEKCICPHCHQEVIYTGDGGLCHNCGKNMGMFDVKLYPLHIEEKKQYTFDMFFDGYEWWSWGE
jgi:hypothetical protein